MESERARESSASRAGAAAAQRGAVLRGGHPVVQHAWAGVLAGGLQQLGAPRGAAAAVCFDDKLVILAGAGRHRRLGRSKRQRLLGARSRGGRLGARFGGGCCRRPRRLARRWVHGAFAAQDGACRWGVVGAARWSHAAGRDAGIPSAACACSRASVAAALAHGCCPHLGAGTEPSGRRCPTPAVCPAWPHAPHSL